MKSLSEYLCFETEPGKIRRSTKKRLVVEILGE
jgi:hypothetical protein